MKFPISRRFSRRGKLPAAAAYENHAAWRRSAAADNTVSILRLFLFSGFDHNLIPYLVIETIAIMAGLFVFDSYYKSHSFDLILKIKGQIIKELDKSGNI